MNYLQKNIMKPKRHSFKKREEKEFDERVLEVARVSRVVKGGRRIRFRATIALGDHKGRVGIGMGKANEVSIAVQKAATQAKKKIITVPIVEGTIPYEVLSTYGAAKVLLKPASSGSSIVAGGAVRTIVELAGITDILAKILGSKSLVNNAFAVIKGLGSFDPNFVEKINGFSNKKIKEVKINEPKNSDKESSKKNQTESKK